MAEPRQKLDAILRQIVKDACGKENVYYQPPANLRMSYPCICYEQSKIQNAAADNRVYLQRIFYQLTVIDSRPDSKITKALMQKYTLLQNGVVVRRIHPKAITRERRKLKAYKRLLDKGIVTMEEIDGYFRSWLSGNYKYMSRDQIYKMNSLYVKLFGRSVTWKKGHGRLRWLMAHPSAT